MTTTLRQLLAVPSLRLRLVTPPDEERLDTAVAWVHSSDLPDPTPWLEAGQVLLTDGGYFQQPAAEADSYVGRLSDAGILALGFATEIIHDSIPDAVVAACARHSLPLFEVDRRTAFMAVIRLVADDIARDRRERLEWSLEAQRAIARAALRPDGLPAILAELGRRLDCWVALFDASGDRVPSPSPRPLPADLLGAVTDQVAVMLSQGGRSGARLELAQGSATFQSLGRRGRLDGVLVVGAAAPLDEAGSDLVASVIALASIALEQSRTLEAARGELRAGILEFALTSDVEAASRIAARAGSPLPGGRLRVMMMAADEAIQPLVEADLFAVKGRRSFVARLDPRRLVIVVAAGALEDALPVPARHGVLAGVSSAVPRAELGEAIAQAGRALDRARPEAPLVQFDDIAAGGLLALLDREGGIEVARAALAPLADDRELIAAIATWLRHNGATDPAARELGIHRHSLSARIARAERALGIDLTRFGDRAELWAALRLVEPGLFPVQHLREQRS